MNKGISQRGKNFAPVLVHYVMPSVLMVYLLSVCLSSGWILNSGNIVLGIYTSLFSERIGTVS